MGPEHFYYGAWWMFPMMMPIFMLVILIIVLYFLFRRGGFKPPCLGNSEKLHIDDQHSESAMDIVKKRYAKGEINKEEFEQMKRDLSS